MTTTTPAGVGPGPTVFADDLGVGELLHLGEYRVEHSEVIEFASHWDDQWFHTNDDAAARGHFGGVIASGIHTLAIMQRLTVGALYSNWAVVAGRGLDRVRFVEAVRPGDTLTGTVEVTGVELDDRRGRVDLHVTLVNQHERVVLVVDISVMLFRREPAVD